MTRGIDYAARREVADRWMTLAERQLRARAWRPETVERDIAWDLATATAVVHTQLPPWTEDPLDHRLARLAHCAPALRLGMRAGGWGLPAAEAAPPGPDTRVDLPALLAAVYPLAEAVERWADLCGNLQRDRVGAVPTAVAAEEAAAALSADVPGLFNHVAHGEVFWGGLAAFGTKMDVIATGRVDTVP